MLRGICDSRNSEFAVGIVQRDNFLKELENLASLKKRNAISPLKFGIICLEYYLAGSRSLAGNPCRSA